MTANSLRGQEAEDGNGALGSILSLVTHFIKLRSCNQTKTNKSTTKSTLNTLEITNKPRTTVNHNTSLVIFVFLFKH